MRGLTFRLLLALCLLASTAQGFVAQTHVHAARPAVAATDATGAAVDASTPVDPACLLCDVAGHSPASAPPVEAHAILVAASQPTLPRLSPSFAVLSAASHHWRGRAPPPV